MTTTSITGHLAMFQAVTAVSPRPTALPIALGQRAGDDQREHDERRHHARGSNVTSSWTGRSL